MSTSDNSSSVILISQSLWNVVISKVDTPLLEENPTIACMKACDKEKPKKDKTITCMHSGLSDHIFTKIIIGVEQDPKWA
uniref:Uncharacterized protein n=1 Tax=Glycine max TaxID=3847 RepID=A0A0R0K5I8_SOYBN